MDRPRLVVILSGMVASAAAFVVVSRGGLLGTAAGAACVPMVYNLVSYWFSAGLDGAAGWARRRVRGPREEEAAGSQAGRASGSEAHSEGRRPAVAHWLVGGFALASLVISVYALTSPDGGVRTVEKVVVKERLVTVTTVVAANEGGSTLAEDESAAAAERSAAAAAAQKADTPSLPAEAEVPAEPPASTETTDPANETSAEEDETSTVTTDPASLPQEPSPPTTTTAGETTDDTESSQPSSPVTTTVTP